MQLRTTEPFKYINWLLQIKFQKDNFVCFIKHFQKICISVKTESNKQNLTKLFRNMLSLNTSQQFVISFMFRLYALVKHISHLEKICINI